MNGLLIGTVLGGAGVFLLGTKTGKNILKILSERGIDGVVTLLEEYDSHNVGEIVEEMKPLRKRIIKHLK